MNIFISGCGGFIGSNLAIKLFKEGHTIYGGDIKGPNKLLTDFRDTYEDREDFLNRMNMYDMDFTSNNVKKEIFKKWNIDLIYHLASPIGVKNIIENSNKTLRDANKINTFFDEVCSEFNIPIIFSSSSEVFGSGEIDINSIYSIKKYSDSPRWTYAAAKTHAEFLFQSGNYPSTVVRFFNVVGIGQTTKGMVIPTFMEQAKKGKALTVLENGIRSYCDIREAIDYIVPIGISLGKFKSESKYNKKDYNIGNSKNIISAEELAKKIIKLYNSNSIISRDSIKYNVDALPVRKLLDYDADFKDNVTVYDIDEILQNLKDYNDRKDRNDENDKL